MKRCTVCGVYKPLQSFGVNKAQKDGLNYLCKTCSAEKSAAYKKANAEKVKAYAAEYRSANKDYFKEKSKEFREKNPTYQVEWCLKNQDRARESWRVRNKRNRPYYASLETGRRTASKRATPAWRDASRIREIYKEAESRRAAGEDVHVDHIVPLRSKLVCGLHVEANLAIIPARENVVKSNRAWPDMPE